MMTDTRNSTKMDVAVDSPYHPFKTQKAKEAYLKLYDNRAQKWPVASTTRMVNTSYGKTFVRISGLHDGKPLVLMHGGGGNSLQWMSNIESLSKQYKVFAIDTINDNGRSIPVKSISNADDYISWLDGVFDALGFKEGINVVGLSYGGWIASQYALKFRVRINYVSLSKVKPSSIHPVIPPIIFLTGLLSFASFMAAFSVALQCGPAQYTTNKVS